jgi:tellurite resistance protein TehA-like permease
VLAVGAYPALADLRGFMIGQTVLFWAVATWWVPLLVAVMIWRHVIGKVPLAYRLDYWSMVFPIGMYTAASWAFSHAVGADFLVIIPRIFVWIAMMTWSATFIGLIRHLIALLRDEATCF